MADSSGAPPTVLTITTKWNTSFVLSTGEAALGYEALQKLVVQAIQQTGPDLAKGLFKEWATELDKQGRLDRDDFKAHLTAARDAGSQAA